MSSEDWVSDLCQKIGKGFSDDLYQELFLILLEKDSEWIEEKYNSGYWEGIVIRIVINQFYGKRTRFDKYFHQPIGTIDIHKYDIADEEAVIVQEYLWDSIEQVTEDLDWYAKKIWQLYCQGDEDKEIKARSARSISRVTGISRQEVLKVINSIKQQSNEYLIDNYRHLLGE